MVRCHGESLGDSERLVENTGSSEGSLVECQTVRRRLLLISCSSSRGSIKAWSGTAGISIKLCKVTRSAKIEIDEEKEREREKEREGERARRIDTE